MKCLMLYFEIIEQCPSPEAQDGDDAVDKSLADQTNQIIEVLQRDDDDEPDFDTTTTPFYGNNF